MEYFIPFLFLLIFLFIGIVLNNTHKKNIKLLCTVSAPNRGTRAERRLVIKMLKKGIHPKAIFHDLYLQKRNGEYSQIDLVVATPQGLLSIEVKDYSGWLFGNEYQRYWTQILNYGKEKYRFYNPIKQNYGHIRTLREQSEQFARLPIFNIVLFAGDCELKNVTYYSHELFVGYTSNIMEVFNRIRNFNPANYTDKKEVVGILHNAVENGNHPEIITQHIASVNRLKKDQPEPTINSYSNYFSFNWRRWMRF